MMLRHTALLLALATVSATTAIPSFAQNADQAGSGNDNYTQAQAAPIERSGPSTDPSAQPNSPYAGQAAVANQNSGGANQPYTNNGQPANSNAQPGYANGAGSGGAVAPSGYYAGRPYVAYGYPYPPYAYGYGYPYGYYGYPYGFGIGFGYYGGYGFRGGYGYRRGYGGGYRGGYGGARGGYGGGGHGGGRR